MIELLAAFSLALTPIQSSQNWRAVNFKSDQIDAIDAGSIRTVRDQKIFWIVSSFREAQDGAAYSMMQLRIECDRQTIAVLHIVNYDSAGETFGSGPASGEADPVVPGSVGSIYLEAVCENEWPDVQPVENVADFLSITRTAFADTEYTD